MGSSTSRRTVDHALIQKESSVNNPLRTPSIAVSPLSFKKSKQPQSFNNLLEISQQERSNTYIKWYVIILACTLWSSTYNSVLSVSALETSMRSELSMTNTQFALLTTVLFFSAIFTALLSPFITNKYDIYWTLIIASFCVILGQTIFTVGIECILYLHLQNTSNYYILLYVGRAFIGFGLGIENVSVSTIASLWFGKSKWLSLAVMILSQTVDIGIVTARDVLAPIKTDIGKDNLARPFYFGIVFGGISLISSFLMLYLEKVYIRNSKTFQNNDKYKNVNLTKLDQNFGLIKEFPAHIWLCILFIMIACSLCETYSTQMTDAYVYTFKLSQWNADLLMSLTSFCGVIGCPLWGIIVSKYGGLTYFAMISQIAMILSSFILGYQLFIGHEIENNKYLLYLAWSSMIGFVLSQEWYIASGFSMLYSNCPVYLISVINSVNAVLYLFGGVITTYLFGLFADLYGYEWSNIMMACVAFCGLVIAIIIHCTGQIKSPRDNKEIEQQQVSINNTP